MNRGSLVVEGAWRQPVLLGGPVTTIGRALGNDLCLDDPTVSRYHARVLADEHGVRILDVGSANGTTVDGRELDVKVECPLTEGSVVGIGPFRVRAHLDSTAPPVAPGGPAAPPGAGAPAGGTVVVARPAVLVVTTADGRREVPLAAGPLTLGRSPDNDVVIDAAAVSRHHARIERHDGTWELVDLGSTNGLTVNGVRVARAALDAATPVEIGRSVTLVLGAPGGRAAAGRVEGAERERVVLLPARGELRIGRSGDADVALANPRVSAVHARIRAEAGRHVLEDLGSAGGTFVNGQVVRERVLAEGDVVRIGSHRLVVSAGGLRLADEAGALQLEARGLTTVVAGGKKILQDVSLSIAPRELVAIVGVSGSGKSTLLNALCGFRPATGGSVLLGGTELYEHYDAYRDEMGYVPQDDIIHRELTVERALHYAARLRMPRDTSAPERDRRIGEVLADLDLTSAATTPVSRLSGGQRKRVSIGVELLTRPGLFFLDEATSGLDPGTEMQMMKLLRRLADDGRTVVLVTHATKNVMMCDQVAFLTRGGRLAYFGPPEQALGYFGVGEFDEIYTRLDAGDPEEWASRFVAHRRANGLEPAGAEAWAPAIGPRPSGPGPRPGRRASPMQQFGVLCRRYLETLTRDRKTAILLASLAPILGVLDFVVWKRDLFDPVDGSATQVATMLFMVSLITILVGTVTSVRELVKEVAIYRRERMVGLQVLPYVASKLAIGFAFALYSAVVLFVCKALAIDMGHLGAAGMVKLLVPMVIGTFSGVAWGLLVSAIAPTEERAMLLVILVLVPQFVFSGGMVPVKDLGAAGTAMGYVTSTRWELGALATAAEVRTGACEAPDASDCMLPGLASLPEAGQKQALIAQLSDQYGDIFTVDVVIHWVASTLLAAGLIVVTVALQRRRDRA